MACSAWTSCTSGTSTWTSLRACAVLGARVLSCHPVLGRLSVCRTPWRCPSSAARGSWSSTPGCAAPSAAAASARARRSGRSSTWARPSRPATGRLRSRSASRAPPRPACGPRASGWASRATSWRSRRRRWAWSSTAGPPVSFVVSVSARNAAFGSPTPCRSSSDWASAPQSLARAWDWTRWGAHGWASLRGTDGSSSRSEALWPTTKAPAPCISPLIGSVCTRLQQHMECTASVQ
mmetsp:Transcript_17179/g.35878  ORF Transcript_17179/g.35878 Transcript_17179/m.35878 type:complete len:236 (+) Transcript_17179:847-1554(+)